MEEKIGGLEIAVNDAVCVSVVQGSSSLVHVRYGLRESECTALCQFTSYSNNLVSITRNGGINKRRNIGIHSN